MNVEQFERALRHFLRQKPFEPFIVEMLDGRVIKVEQPNVAFGGGAASLLTPNYDLIEFVCEETETIRPVRARVAGG